MVCVPASQRRGPPDVWQATERPVYCDRLHPEPEGPSSAAAGGSQAVCVSWLQAAGRKGLLGRVQAPAICPPEAAESPYVWLATPCGNRMWMVSWLNGAGIPDYKAGYGKLQALSTADWLSQ